MPGTGMPMTGLARGCQKVATGMAHPKAPGCLLQWWDWVEEQFVWPPGWPDASDGLLIHSSMPYDSGWMLQISWEVPGVSTESTNGQPVKFFIFHCLFGG